MARSALTAAELDAQAMLLGEGWWYDALDHTFVIKETSTKVKSLDADTMEELPYDSNVDGGDELYKQRKAQVRKGELGYDREEEQARSKNGDRSIHGQESALRAASGRGLLGATEDEA